MNEEGRELISLKANGTDDAQIWRGGLGKEQGIEENGKWKISG